MAFFFSSSISDSNGSFGFFMVGDRGSLTTIISTMNSPSSKYSIASYIFFYIQGKLFPRCSMVLISTILFIWIFFLSPMRRQGYDTFLRRNIVRCSPFLDNFLPFVTLDYSQGTPLGIF